MRPSVVDVTEKKIESSDALGKASFHSRPLRCRDNARYQVIWEDVFFPAIVAAVYGKGDALIEKAELGGMLATLQLIRRQRREAFEKAAHNGDATGRDQQTSRRKRCPEGSS